MLRQSDVVVEARWSLAGFERAVGGPHDYFGPSRRSQGAVAGAARVSIAEAESCMEVEVVVVVTLGHTVTYPRSSRPCRWMQEGPVAPLARGRVRLGVLRMCAWA